MSPLIELGPKYQWDVFNTINNEKDHAVQNKDHHGLHAAKNCYAFEARLVLPTYWNGEKISLRICFSHCQFYRQYRRASFNVTKKTLCCKAGFICWPCQAYVRFHTLHFDSIDETWVLVDVPWNKNKLIWSCNVYSTSRLNTFWDWSF